MNQLPATPKSPSSKPFAVEFLNWFVKVFALVVAVKIASTFMTSDAFQKLINP